MGGSEAGRTRNGASASLGVQALGVTLLCLDKWSVQSAALGDVVDERVDELANRAIDAMTAS